jgi:predicted PurR-regulated permease PerM
MPEVHSTDLYKTLKKVVLLITGIVILLWFLHTAASMVLLFLFAIILSIVINMPVVWLEKKGWKRGWACAAVFGVILLVIILLAWLIIPKISAQVTSLINNLPGYASQLSKNISGWFTNYPQIQQEIQEQGVSLSVILPELPKTLMRIGNYSLSLITFILIGILFVSMVVYAVSNPRPLLQLYFSFFSPTQHDKAQRAIQHTSVMLGGWIKANIIGGAIRAVSMTTFLGFMGVPGAWVWGAVAFIAELIPKLGFYIASIPPILVALSVSPSTALWTTVFLLALDEVMGDFILPKLRSNTMNIHPVSILFILLAMTTIFGVMGALLATPLTAIIKAYYEAFLIKPVPEDQLQARMHAVLFNEGRVEGKEK